eukprot:COSAG06_NODE_25675_length_631_cov_0.962406_1_plen_21_part_10
MVQKDAFSYLICRRDGLQAVD